MKKKRIPECNDAYKEALVQKVLDAEVVYEWECVLKDGSKILPTLFVLIAGFAFSYPMRESWVWFGVAGITVVIGLASYFLFYADRDYLCQITPYGIRCYETERIPEGFYKANRAVAYVGIVVCVIAVIFVGPMAFVGAGGSALMAFQMRNFHKNTEVKVIPFASEVTYDYSNFCGGYKNGLRTYEYDIPSYNCHESDSLDELYNFHWIGINCTPEQHPEIHDVITQYITATLEKDEEEETVTQ